MRDVRAKRPSAAQAAIWSGGRRFVGWLVRRRLALTVEGIERVPSRGPVVIAARHYHHVYDGCLLIGVLDRPIHVVAGLDWVERRPLRRGLEALCAVTQWPVILRTDRWNEPSPDQLAEARRYLRRATEETVGLLRGGGLVVLFPEGYPNVDPNPTPKQGPDHFLPFHHGFV
jgi:putative membrane protein